MFILVSISWFEWALTWTFNHAPFEVPLWSILDKLSMPLNRWCLLRQFSFQIEHGMERNSGKEKTLWAKSPSFAMIRAFSVPLSRKLSACTYYKSSWDERHEIWAISSARCLQPLTLLLQSYYLFHVFWGNLFQFFSSLYGISVHITEV